MRRIKTLEERLWAKVDRNGPVPAGFDTPCWLWTAATRRGYGTIGLGRRGAGLAPAHRVAYELLVGTIPAGLVIDHLCRNRSCVNPAHLEPVTEQVNMLRGTGASARNAVKTRCPQGHEYTPENTYASGGNRHCRECSIKRQRAYDRRRALARR